MQQMYATGSIAQRDTGHTPAPGRSLRLPTVKAATSGLSPDRLDAVLPHSLYAGNSYSIRLALLNTPTGRVLTHTVPSGESYFTHTLFNIPDTADAQLAIQTWGSPQWQRTAPENATELPELPYLPVADVLDDQTLKLWLETPFKRELLEFTLTALLGTLPETQVYLSASADDVAKVVYAVTRALPANLLDPFTFSTYEANPLACSARLVGSDCGDEADLPDACYRRGAAFNAYSGKRTDLSTSVPYATYAATALADGELAKLDDLKLTWQRLGLTDAKRFDLVYRLSSGSTLTKAEAIEAVQHAPLAAWLTTRPATLSQLLDWALDDRGFANTTFVRIVQSLRQTPEVLNRLATTVRDTGFTAVSAGDKTRAATALEVVLPMLTPTKANAVWGELFAQVVDPNQLSWEMRWYLLPRLVRFKHHHRTTGGVDPALNHWLDVPSDRLTELLALDVPKAYHLAGCRTCLNQVGEPTEAVTATLATHSNLVLSLLQSSPSEKAATALYQSLLTHAPSRPWFEDVIGSASEFAPELLNRFFEVSLTTNTIDADRLIRSRGRQLLDLFAGQSALNKLGMLFLATPPGDILNNQTVQSFLDKLREQDGLSDELKTRLDAVKAVRTYLDNPQFTTPAIEPVTTALALSPSPLPITAKTEVFQAVSDELTKRFNSPDLQAELEVILRQFGTTLANDPTDLYENLLRDVRTRSPEFGRNGKAVHTFLALALGASCSKDLKDELDGLDGHAFAVAADAARWGGNRLLDSIDAQSKDWPKEARTKWGFLLAAVRPKSRWRRDLVCGAIGASLALVVGLLLKFAL